MFGVYYIDANYPNEAITKLYTTRMAQYVIQKMEDKMNPNSPSKLLFAGLSGHESNMIPFMLQYNLTTLDCMIANIKSNTPPPVAGCEASPKFAANFMWELSTNTDGQYFVGTFYNNKLIKSCDNPNSDNYCAYEDFKNFLQKNFILSDKEFTSTCGADSQTTEKKVWFYVAIGLVVLFVVQLVLFLVYYRKTNKKATGKKEKLIDDNEPL
jgi:hypothetical protein